MQFAFSEENNATKNELIDNRLKEAFKNRYVHFPINLNEHWTVAIFDTEGGEWLHYNSMKPADSTVDPHFTIAKRLVRITKTINYIYTSSCVRYLKQNNDFNC